MSGATSGTRLRRVAEAIVLTLAVLAPWAFGSVDAWAEFALAVGIGLAAVLVAVAGGASELPWRRRLLCPPSLGLIGLVLLALVQVAPLSDGLLSRLDPSSAALRADLLPGVPGRVLGDQGPPVPQPPPTLSQNRDATFQAAARLLMAWLLLQTVLGLGGGRAALRRYGRVLAANATLLALFALIQALTWNGRIFWLRPSPNGAWSGGGPFVCHSHLAEYLNLGLGFALAFLLTETRGGFRGGRGSQLWAAYAAGMIAVGVITSHSRGGFVSMLVATTALLALVRTGSSRRVPAARVLTGLVAMLSLGGLFLLVVGSASPYLQRLATLGDAQQSSLLARMEIWGSSLRAWGDHPVWGTGLGTFPVAAAPYFDLDRGVYFARAENEPIDLLVEGGLVGGFLALFALVGLARLAHRALAGAPTVADRTLVVGGLFGVLAVAVHSCSDFGLHVLGVAVPVVVLVAHLSRLGLALAMPVPTGAVAGSVSPDRVLAGRVLAGVLAGVLAMVPILNGLWNTTLEARIAAAGLPAPGSLLPSVGRITAPRDELERARQALAAALVLRPDWAEGHLRLGQVHLALYERMATEWLTAAASEDDAMAALADPIWLLGVVQTREAEEGRLESELLTFEPIRDHLVPAARSFLEARRCCPVSALAHAGLARVAYLLEEDAPASTHAQRALRLAGNDGGLIVDTALVAVQAGDLDLAARAWRRALQVDIRGGRWESVADTSAMVLPPEQILEAVVPDGRSAVRFAGRLYAAPGQEAIRDQFLRAALTRLPHDTGLAHAERLHLEAQARAGLGDPDRALALLEAALRLEPSRSEWRDELIGWLLSWGRLEEAHDQALVWSHLIPGDSGARRALERTAGALARGAAGPDSSR